MHPKHERTYCMIKPDGVKRGLIGEIIVRLERCGLKVVACQMVQPTEDQIDNHYPKDEAWINRLGEKTMKTYKKYGFDAMEELGTTDTLEIGKKVRSWILKFMTSGPVLKMVIEGPHAIDMVRKLAGDTIPAFADVGTIRGDFSVDSAAAANKDKRQIYNIVHASETPEESAHEIEHWFSPEDICSYERVSDESKL